MPGFAAVASLLAHHPRTETVEGIQKNAGNRQQQRNLPHPHNLSLQRDNDVCQVSALPRNSLESTSGINSLIPSIFAKAGSAAVRVPPVRDHMREYLRAFPRRVLAQGFAKDALVRAASRAASCELAYQLTSDAFNLSAVSSDSGRMTQVLRNMNKGCEQDGG